MKVGVLVFPGSNCDHDAYHAAKHVMGMETEFVWHKEDRLHDFDLVVVPGGFSYGDYLRAGAIARFSPIMEAVQAYARDGGLVIGICNGFQILCESHLLPGALMRNEHLRFTCKHIYLRVERADTPFTNQFEEGEVIAMPVANGEGNFVAEDDVATELEAEGRVVFRYCDEGGQVTSDANPNGSVDNIAGIINREGNVLGLMPHPERCVEPLLGQGRADGVGVFESVRNRVQQSAAVG